jgi:serine/threonine-protein kinase
VDLAPGSIVAGRFVLDRRLGEGGMGVVWAATHAVTRKVVALKVLKPDKAGDETLRRRFVREARAASAVVHPNIIEIRDVIELDDGAPAMVMDLLEGESLGARLERDGVLGLDVLAPIMAQVTSAVGTAHAAGVVHRDLKPDNIFLVPDGRGVSVRVLDFGIAKLLPAPGEVAVGAGLTTTGVILGTPYYMAPEQHFGERDIDCRADVWALGVILYQCLSGRRPTEAENVGQILRRLASGTIVPLREVATGVPEDVAELVDRMLDRERSRRPASLVEAHALMTRYAPGVETPSFREPAAAAWDATTPPPPSAEPVRTAVVQPERALSPSGPTLASTTRSTTSSSTTDRLPSVPARHTGLVVGGAVATMAAIVVCAMVLSAGGPSTPPGAAAGAAIVTPPPPASPRSTMLVDPAPSGEPADAAPSAAVAAAPASTHTRPPVLPAQHPASSTVPATPAAASSTPRFNPYEHM